MAIITKVAPFMPEIWSDKIAKSLREELVMAGMQSAFDWQPPVTCPLSKQIIMDDIQELIALQPDKHMIEILQDIVDSTEGAQRADTQFAELVNQAVCSLRSACKNDSSDDS